MPRQQPRSAAANPAFPAWQILLLVSALPAAGLIVWLLGLLN